MEHDIANKRMKVDLYVPEYKARHNAELKKTKKTLYTVSLFKKIQKPIIFYGWYIRV